MMELSKILKLLFRGGRGCTYLMTKQERNIFYHSLWRFQYKDKMFFSEQLNDLTKREKKEFSQYAKHFNSIIEYIKQDVISK